MDSLAQRQVGDIPGLWLMETCYRSRHGIWAATRPRRPAEVFEAPSGFPRKKNNEHLKLWAVDVSVVVLSCFFVFWTSREKEWMTSNLPPSHSAIRLTPVWPFSEPDSDHDHHHHHHDVFIDTIVIRYCHCISSCLFATLILSYGGWKKSCTSW